MQYAICYRPPWFAFRCRPCNDIRGKHYSSAAGIRGRPYHEMSGVGGMAGGGQRDDAGGWRTAQATVLHAGLSSRNQPANYYRDVVLAAAIEGVLQQRLTYLAG